MRGPEPDTELDVQPHHVKYRGKIILIQQYKIKCNHINVHKTDIQLFTAIKMNSCSRSFIRDLEIKRTSLIDPFNRTVTVYVLFLPTFHFLLQPSATLKPVLSSNTRQLLLINSWGNATKWFC